VLSKVGVCQPSVRRALVYNVPLLICSLVCPEAACYLCTANLDVAEVVDVDEEREVSLG
jgi:hypothetical protein